MTPEGIVKKKVRALLAEFDHVHVAMPVQNGMGAPLLDFHCCVRGFYLAIETKRDGGVLTPRQRVTMAELERAGAHAMLVSNDSHLNELEAWLCAHTSRKAVGCTAPAHTGDGA